MIKTLKDYIDICEEIKKLTEEKKIIENSLVEDGFESEKIGNQEVKKIITNRVYIKKGVDTIVIAERFPQAVKTEIDMDVLKATPDAQEYLELRPSTSFRIFTKKNAAATEEDDF